MTTAHLRENSSNDDLSLDWARFILSELVGRRERKEAAIRPNVFVFEADEGDIPVLPTHGHDFDPEDPQSVRAILARHPTCYAYLISLPGQPIRAAAQKTPTGAVATATAPIGVPETIIDPGDFPFYLMAYLHSATVKMVFCGAFDGEKFNTVNCMEGCYGGTLSSLLDDDN
jgi:hypothetical protein